VDNHLIINNKSIKKKDRTTPNPMSFFLFGNCACGSVDLEPSNDTPAPREFQPCAMKQLAFPRNNVLKMRIQLTKNVLTERQKRLRILDNELAKSIQKKIGNFKKKDFCLCLIHQRSLIDGYKTNCL
jgi:hypothetical protein